MDKRIICENNNAKIVEKKPAEKDNNIDFRNLLRKGDEKSLNLAIDSAMKKKPKSHDFDISYKNQTPAVDRHMSVTGG